MGLFFSAGGCDASFITAKATADRWAMRHNFFSWTSLTGLRSQAMFRPMNYDYSKRGYLLPEGCKDLVDVIRPKTAITKRGFVITVQLSVQKRSDVQIIAEGSTLRIITRQWSSRTIEVPGAYPLTGARAMYLKDRLRIVVPKVGSDTAPEPN